MSMEDPSDRSLVLRTRQGDDEAYGELVTRHQNQVFNVCYRLLGERREAEDMSQETFIRAYEKLATFDVERPFGPWIRRVATNVCLNQLKKFKMVHLEYQDELDEPRDDPEPGPEDQRVLAERHLMIRRALRALPVHYRAVIELRHFHELSYAEISNELGIPLSDVKSHLYRARRQLAERLKKHESFVR